MRKLLLLPIRVYQYAISPMMASHCRHYPTCSQYAIDAITTHGAVKGLFLAMKRLLRCHPWAKGGYDPVPGTEVCREVRPTTCCGPASQTHNTNPTKQ
ncbi:membrane protein insertion efficiency factor YidD [Marinobacter vulgaris]|uniref:Putative membrane protein insertion efficiency factor n=1 Tax=Marinobacter vulgaris TaxID=1928331 RepID=A0A2V4A269_9GAMM|nr:membrane protein insertion efficiency factor YidD [Marinobacter vulgaris]PXX92664.1 membrane protein insertion efficiency factor YidD [Marinobacter vulgaris]TSJ71391.1 membrane protein insertion efficiency factor YidD [Marinobacter vulgaris]